MKVSVKVTSLRPRLAPEFKEFESLLPNVIIPEQCDVNFDGVSSSFSNAFRRTIACELPVKVLKADFYDIEFDEPFTIQEYIQKSLSMVPIRQDIPLDMTFSLDVSNPDQAQNKKVRTGDIVPLHGPKTAKYFNSNIVLCELSPLKFIRIKKIYVVEEYGWDKGYAVMASHVASTTDEPKFDAYENPGGARSSASNVRRWKLSFVNSGRMGSRAVLKMAANNIIERLKAVEKADIVEYESTSDVILRNESVTIGQLLMQHIVQTLNISCKITPDPNQRIVTLSIVGDDARDVMRRTVSELIKQVEVAKNKFGDD